MTASPTDVREWLRLTYPDREVSDRGRISAADRADYEAHHDGARLSEPPGEPEGAGAADDTGEVLTASEPHAPQRAGAVTETRPRPAKTVGGRGGLLGRGRAAARRKRQARPKAPRISVAPFIEHFWGDLAWAAAPVPPMQKLLYTQAPYAGIVLEQRVRGTVADKVLQPLARAEALGEAMFGLLGPPAFLMAALQTAPAPGEAPTARHVGALSGLRFSLLSMSRVAGVHLAEVQQRAEQTAQQAADVDEFMAWLFEAPVPDVSTAAGAPGGTRDQAAEHGARLMAKS